MRKQTDMRPIEFMDMHADRVHIQKSDIPSETLMLGRVMLVAGVFWLTVAGVVLFNL